MKFLICGIGSIGLRHLKNLKSLGFSDIIIYRTGRSTIENIIEETKGLAVFNDFDEALAQKPHVCMITNPTSMHLSFALKAASVGCDLYIEKPISNSLDGLSELENIVEKNKLITLVTYQFRYHPHLNKLKEIFESEVISYGRPLYVTTEWSEYLPDWHPWENYKNSYAARPDLGGGVLLTQIHPLNYLSYIFGDIMAAQKSVTRTGALGIQVDDSADLLLEFEQGFSGHVHIDFLQKPRVHTMKIVTSTGRFEWDYHANSLVFVGNESRQQIFDNNDFSRNDMFLDMLTDFITCVTNREKTRFDVPSAIRELKLIL